jgi:hypothetical protein
VGGEEILIPYSTFFLQQILPGPLVESAFTIGGKCFTNSIHISRMSEQFLLRYAKAFLTAVESFQLNPLKVH